MFYTLLALACLLLYISTRKPRNFPPGPMRLPIIGRIIKGSLPRQEEHKYGKYFGMFLGNFPSVVIQDFQLAKQLFNRDEWCGRSQTFVSRYLRADNGVNKGIITTDGQLWHEQRRFALKHLKDFGFGREGLEGTIQDEAEETIKYLETQTSKDFKMETVFGVPVINILWTIVAGKRFEANDPWMQRTMKLLNKLFKSKFFLEYVFSWYGILVSFIPGLNTRKKVIQELRGMFRETFMEHQKTLDTNHPRDLTDVYIEEVNKGMANFDLEQYELLCLDLFKAGAETSSTTLLWCVLYLARHQDEQNKCYKEIMQEVGNDRPALAHNLPYCQAFIHEVQRLAAVAPQSIPHRVTQNTKLDSYDVPENSLAMVTLASFMWDPEYWEEAQLFRPERFLEETPEGLKLVNKDQFVPYGIGKRKCMGASLARDTLFIFFASLVQKFSFAPPLRHPLPDPAAFTEGFTIIPHPFWVKIDSREK